MNRKLISSLLLGLFLIGLTSTFTSCSDYDDDISDLRNAITTNATDLNSLVDEKIADVEKEIAALNSQAKALEDAYKAADNALDAAIQNASNDAKGYADIQAAEAQRAAIAAAQKLVDDAVSNLEAGLKEANAVIGEQGKTIESLLAADKNLQDGIDGALARANQAYKLAEQVKSLAEDNQEQLDKIAKSLETVNSTLESLQDQLNVLGDGITSVRKAAETNAAKIEEQENSINDLKDANAKVLDALATTDTQLRELIEANQAKIAGLEAAVDEAKEAAAQALVDAKEYTDQEVAKLKEILASSETVAGINIKLGQLEEAYKAADKELSKEIDALKVRVTANETAITKINAAISSINDKLAALLIDNVNNLITSIIFQDQSKPTNVYAKVLGNIANVTSHDGSDWAFFPYANAKGYTELKVGSYNVQEWAGYIYATINPTDIDATKASIKLENSLGENNKYYSLGTAEPAEDHLIKTRAAQSKNGLWRIPVKSVTTRENPSENIDNAAYALYTDYEQNTLDEEGNIVAITKKVVSHYAIGLNPDPAPSVSQQELELIGTDETANNINGRVEFKSHSGDAILGTNNKRVYKKYVECIEVKHNGNKVDGGAEKFNSANSAVLQTVLDASNEGENDIISLNCPQDYINYVITLKYYIWNYNGTIYSIEKDVVFNEYLWNPAEVAVTATPESDGKCGDYAQIFSELDFIKPVKSELTGKYWKDEARYVEAVSDEDSKGMDGAFIYLQNDKKSSTYETVKIGGNMQEMTVNSLGNIKEAKVVIDLNNTNKDIMPETDYTVTLKFYNNEKYVINIVKIKYRMEIPTGKPEPWRITSAFYKDDLTIAWAKLSQYPSDGAKYEFKGSFVPLVNKGMFGENSPYVFEYTTPEDYNANGKYEVYGKSVRLLNPETGFEYQMVVPKEALNGQAGTEHEYNLTAGIKFFGINNLISSHTDNGFKDDFKIKFLSPIRYSILGTEKYITGKTYAGIEYIKPISVEYKGASVKVGNDNFRAYDPQEASNVEVKFFENQDGRIKSVEIAPDPYDSNKALFSKITKEADGSWSLTTSDFVSVTSDTKVKFTATVTDVWGAVTTFDFEVTVIANK